jgi:hypothetical protein
VNSRTYIDQLFESVYGSHSELYHTPAEPNQEYVVAAAVMDRNRPGDVWLGDHHQQARSAANLSLGSDGRSPVYTHGFYTNTGRFVDRYKACKIAAEARQTSESDYLDALDVMTDPGLESMGMEKHSGRYLQIPKYWRERR